VLSATPADPSASAPAVSTTAHDAVSPSPVRRTASPPAAPAGRTSTPDSPITAYTACASAGTARFTATFKATFEWHHVFISSDADTATGYRVPEVGNGLGADFMVENDTLYRSTGSAWGWTALDGAGPLLSRAGGTYRWQVPLDAVAGQDEPLLVVINGSGTSPEAYTRVVTVGPC
jgi:hypothetical protein